MNSNIVTEPEVDSDAPASEASADHDRADTNDASTAAVDAPAGDRTDTTILADGVAVPLGDTAPALPAAVEHADAEIIQPLSTEQKQTLASLEEVIDKMKRGIVVAFFTMIAAFYRIKEEKLYRGTHTSFEAYFSEKWSYKRSHSYRLADAGEIVQRQEASPRGDTIKLLDSESHYRPIAKLAAEQQDEVLDLIAQWVGWSGQKKVSPRMVESAVAVLHPPIEAAEPKLAKNALAEKFAAAVEAVKFKLPADTSKETRQLFDQLKKKAVALRNPTRTTGIDWTEATWNPLQGCSPASAGCTHCYAAKLVATRLARVYPGLASEKAGKDGKKTYVFNNVIQLLPEQLGVPLKDRVPKRYFVNSMSDLFHPKVPDDFITAAFQVMEKAHWHQFQVLTKRPERMAKFTAEYWKDKTPPAHIWLGTSTENQKALDERYPSLLKVKAAVRWLSIEPLIGPITFDSLDGIDWVVVGGESGSKRKMEKAWATDIRDACVAAGVAFLLQAMGRVWRGRQEAEEAQEGWSHAAQLGWCHPQRVSRRNRG